MDTIETVVLIVHTFIALLIIALVLLQRGKGADAGAAFGSGASGTVFGSRGSASFFSRATAVLATAFFVSSLALAYMSSQQADVPDSLLERAPASEGVTEEPADDAAGTPEVPELPGTEAAPAEEAGGAEAEATRPEPAPETPPDDAQP